MIRITAVVLLLATASAITAQEKGALARAWTVVKSEEAPPGTKIVFGNDGKLMVTYVVDGKSHELTGSYSLVGDKLTMKLAHDGRERVETRTVKKLTETVLITEDKNRKVEELSAAK